MQEQTITFRWRTFEEETPQSGRDILVKTPASPLYWWTRTAVYGRHMMLCSMTYLSKAKRDGLLWCYCDEIDEQAPPIGKASIITVDGELMETTSKKVWTELVSDELKDMLVNLKSDNGVVPLGTVDKLIQLFVNDIERLGNQSS